MTTQITIVDLGPSVDGLLPVPLDPAVIKGDTGTTGFPPGIVSGLTLSGAAASVIAANTGVTTQAQLDRGTAHTALTNLVTPPANILSSVLTFGGGTVYAPGNYQFLTSANQLGAVVRRPKVTESTALGAAFAALRS